MKTEDKKEPKKEGSRRPKKKGSQTIPWGGFTSSQLSAPFPLQRDVV